MNQELFKQAMTMFNSPEKWNAFIELVSQKDNIIDQWFLKLTESAKKKFLAEDLVQGWEFKTWGTFGMKWYLKEYGENSISLILDNGAFSLYAEPNFNNLEVIQKLLKTEIFAPLLQCFNRFDSLYQEGGKLITEDKNFSFGSPYDSKFDFDRLAWYAGNKSKDFLNQISEKVNKFRKDEKMNFLLNQLNQEAKNK